MKKINLVKQFEKYLSNNNERELMELNYTVDDILKELGEFIKTQEEKFNGKWTFVPNNKPKHNKMKDIMVMKPTQRLSGPCGISTMSAKESAKADEELKNG
jgi:phosphatidate phosphatase PAH1